MKKIITFSILIIAAWSLNGQHYYSYVHHGGAYSNSYDGDNYYDRGYNSHGYDKHGHRSIQRYSSLSKKDQRKIRRLEKSLVECKRDAWKDGYLSRRDRTRIAKAQSDIDVFWARHIQNERNNNRGYSNNRVCR